MLFRSNDTATTEIYTTEHTLSLHDALPILMEIGGHATHIESCQGGVHLYHVHLADPDRVISITAAGEGRFGERVVAGLTE